MSFLFAVSFWQVVGQCRSCSPFRVNSSWGKVVLVRRFIGIALASLAQSARFARSLRSLRSRSSLAALWHRARFARAVRSLRSRIEGRVQNSAAHKLQFPADGRRPLFSWLAISLARQRVLLRPAPPIRLPRSRSVVGGLARARSRSHGRIWCSLLLARTRFYEAATGGASSIAAGLCPLSSRRTARPRLNDRLPSPVSAGSLLRGQRRGPAELVRQADV